MALTILRGNVAPQLQHFLQSYSPRRGLTAEYSYRGLDAGQMSTLANSCILAGFEIEFDQKFNVASLTVRSPDGSGASGTGAQTIIDKWEVAVDEEKPSLFENQNFLQMALAPDAVFGCYVSSQLIGTIQNVAQSSTPSWAAFAAHMSDKILDNNGKPLDSGAELTDAYGGVSAQLQLFVLDYLRGATNFVHSKYVLRHTTSVPNNYTLDVSDFNVELIYSISQLLSEAQNGGLWILPLPAYLAYKIMHYPVPVAVPDDFMFGALKLRANAVTAARNRVEIQQEYLIDAWPIHTYGLA